MPIGECVKSQRTALNGILTFIPDEGDDSNYIPISLLPPTVKRTTADFYSRHSYDFLILNSYCPYFILFYVAFTMKSSHGSANGLPITGISPQSELSLPSSAFSR